MENNGEIQKQVIDLGLRRNGTLEENAYTQMGAQLGYALKQILVGVEPFLDVRGTTGDLEDIIKYGANSPQARRSLGTTNQAASRFQKVTGIPWPFSS